MHMVRRQTLRKWWIRCGIVLGIIGLMAWAVLHARHQAQLNSALLHSLRTKNQTAALKALDAGADPNVRYIEGQPPSFSFWTTLRRFFLPPAEPPPHSVPALIMATQNEQVAVIRKLLQKGADPQARGQIEAFQDLTALHEATAGEDNDEVIEALIAGGAPVMPRMPKVGHRCIMPAWSKTRSMSGFCCAMVPR
jgi:hypothetical protein